ncbi:hypothetical protein H0H92_014780, partial [Tricholoma furcatifolium]
MPEAQKALFLQVKGGPLVVGERHVPTPGPGQLLVQIKAAGLNPMDIFVQKYGLFIDRYPAVSGYDASGVVVKVGPGVSGFAPGDRVVFGVDPQNENGAFQQYSLTGVQNVAK